MKTVIALRGVPGCGKSTLAHVMLGENPDGSIVRINNDEIVAMLFGTNWRRQQGIAETLKATRESLLKVYLQQPHINTIIIDNTNLQMRTVSSLQKITHRFGANFVVDDTLLHVPTEVCIERDALRSTPVGEEVIRKMAKDAAKLRPWKSPTYEVPVIETYNNYNVALPMCYLFDIDGTMAINASGRDVHDESRVLEDAANWPVLALYLTLRTFDSDIIFMTGRHETCRQDTLSWLQLRVDANITNEQLHMRGADDNRPDYIVKHELFQEHIAGKYRVAGAFDDRDQVVDLWRNKLGLPTFQVSNGDF